MSDDTNLLTQQAEFGLQVQSFLQSKIGRYLIQRAEAQVEEATEGLKTVDPEDPKAIRELQNQVAVAASVQYWLADAILAGDSAQQQLSAEGM